MTLMSAFVCPCFTSVPFVLPLFLSCPRHIGLRICTTVTCLILKTFFRCGFSCRQSCVHCDAHRLPQLHVQRASSLSCSLSFVSAVTLHEARSWLHRKYPLIVHEHPLAAHYGPRKKKHLQTSTEHVFRNVVTVSIQISASDEILTNGMISKFEFLCYLIRFTDTSDDVPSQKKQHMC